MSSVQFGVDWSKQHCGVHQAPFIQALKLMPDLVDIFDTFPDVHANFTWDIKVHLLMPRQYPCIPDWHVDNVPRVNGIQQPASIRPELPMYLWLSGAPLTQFANGYLEPGKWQRFNQTDRHRGSPAAEHGWRGFIRASHKDILPPRKDGQYLRRHTQVYLDASDYQW